jgi:hypothetical protein
MSTSVDAILSAKAARDEFVTATAAMLRTLHPEPGDVFEIRALNVPMGRAKPATAAGYFDDPTKAAAAIFDLEKRKPAGIYTTLNPCLQSLLARAENRLIDYPPHTTTDQEIVARRWLFIDIDPVRPSGIAASESERRAAENLAADVAESLRSSGWPYPHVTADSGNGQYLLYRLALPNTDEATSLVKRTLAGIRAMIGSHPGASIDVSVFNAARIVRVHNTTNRKGCPTVDRPHRPCIYHLPESGTW